MQVLFLARAGAGERRVDLMLRTGWPVRGAGGGVEELPDRAEREVLLRLVTSGLQDDRNAAHPLERRLQQRRLPGPVGAGDHQDDGLALLGAGQFLRNGSQFLLAVEYRHTPHGSNVSAAA